MSDLGFGPYIIKLFKQNLDDNQRKAVFTNSLFVFFILSIISVIIYGTFVDFDDFKVFIFLISITCFFNVIGLSETILLISGRQIQYSYITNALQVTAPLIIIFFLFFYKNINAFFIGYIITRLISLIIAQSNINIKSLFSLNHLNYLEFKNIVSFNFWYLLSKSNRVLKDYLDLLLISLFLDQKYILIYSISIKVPQLAINILNRPSIFIVEKLSSSIANKNIRYISLYLDKLQLFWKNMLPIIGLIYFLLIKWIITVWVGIEYFAGELFALMAFLLLCKEILFNYVGLIFLYSNLKRLALIQSLENIFNVILSIYLIKYFSINGLLIASLISSLPTIILLPVAIFKLYPSIKIKVNFLFNFFIIISSSTLLWVFVNNLNFSYSNWAVFLLLFTTVYVLKIYKSSIRILKFFRV